MASLNTYFEMSIKLTLNSFLLQKIDCCWYHFCAQNNNNNYYSFQSQGVVAEYLHWFQRKILIKELWWLKRDRSISEKIPRECWWSCSLIAFVGSQMVSAQGDVPSMLYFVACARLCLSRKKGIKVTRQWWLPDFLIYFFSNNWYH